MEVRALIDSAHDQLLVNAFPGVCCTTGQKLRIRSLQGSILAPNKSYHLSKFRLRGLLHDRTKALVLPLLDLCQEFLWATKFSFIPINAEPTGVEFPENPLGKSDAARVPPNAVHEIIEQCGEKPVGESSPTLVGYRYFWGAFRKSELFRVHLRAKKILRQEQLKQTYGRGPDSGHPSNVCHHQASRQTPGRRGDRCKLYFQRAYFSAHRK